MRLAVLLMSGLVVLLLGSVWVSDAGAQTAASISPHGTQNLVCRNCHTLDAWRPLRATPRFNHDAETAYALAGTHAVTPCRGCHLALRFDEPKLDGDPCQLCHVDVHQGRFIRSCDACHDAESFEEVNGDQLHNQTAFPLTGAHREATCQACHFDDQDGAYTTRDTNCFFCHDVVFEVAPTDHRDRGFPTECQICHTTFGWTDGRFDHVLLSSGFVLMGAHATAPCGSCHNQADLSFETRFATTDANDCIACHQGGFERAHAGRGFPTTCLTCHNTSTWQGGSFQHAVAAQGFQLLGAHAAAPCDACHVSGTNTFDPIFAPADQNDCFTCHEQGYQRRHGGSGTSILCLDCHTVNRWTN